MRSGRLVAVAVTSRRRVASLPGVPTVAESGFPGFEIYSWYGALVSPGASSDVVTQLHRALVRAIGERDVRARLDVPGMTPVANTPAQFRAELEADVERWARELRAAQLTLER